MNRKIFFGGLAAAFFLLAIWWLLPKQMPLEGVLLGGKAPGTVKDGTVSREDPIVLEIDTPTSLEAVLPQVESVRVAGASAPDSADLVWDADKGVLTATCSREGPQEFSLTFSAPGYRDAVCTWPVEVALHSMTLEVSLPSQEEPLADGTTLLLAEGGTPKELAIRAGAPDALLKLDDSGCGGVAAAALEGNTLTLTPLGVGKGTLTVTASASRYQDAVLTLEVEVLPVIQVSADRESLVLAPGESAQVTLSSDPPEVSFEAEGTGDAAVRIEGNLLTVTAGQTDAQVTVRAKAPGFAAGELVIPVSVSRSDAIVSDSTLSVPPADTSAWDEMIAGILEYTNQARAAEGVPPLKHIPAVDTPAMLRARESDTLWSHTRPDGSNFNTVFAQVGLSYPGVGENLFSANALLSAREVVDAWLASPDHRRNLLDARFTGMGAGVWQGEEYTCWCQLLVME